MSQVRILGPIEVSTGHGRSARIPRGRTLSLLALLLVHRGASVALDRIVDELWEGDQPQNARNAVQVVASRLRAAIGDGALVSEAHGYSVRVAPAAVDADRFEDGLRRGHEQLMRGEAWEAAATLREALALWRGPALADVGEEGFAQPEIARLEDLRVACLTDRLDAELACGRHEEVAGELERLVPRHPLRERLRGQQMLALYRSGRQADALEAYRSAYDALVAGLGIEPSPELRALQAAILRHEVPVAAPPPERTNLTPDVRRRVTCVLSRLAVPHADPESLRAWLERHHDAVRAACARHGGSVAELRGDSVLVVFGAPLTHEDDPLRALRMASELRAGREPLALGVGTGEVVAQASAPETAPLVGEAPGIAEALARAAAAGEIRVDDSTWHLIRHAARAAALREGGFLLMSIDADAPAIRRQLDRPLVGREEELRRLRATFERVVETRTPRLLTIVGESGIGKTRLAAELAAIASERGRLVSGRCPAYGEGMTYWPLRTIVEQALDAAPAQARQLAVAVGLEPGTPGEDPGWALRSLVVELARTQPLTMLIDDAHLAEPGLLGLLFDVVARLRDVPALVAWVARPDLFDRHGWQRSKPGRVHAGTTVGQLDMLELKPLSDGASAALLEAIAPGPLAAADQRRITAAAGGNPLYLEQLVAFVNEGGGAPHTLPPALHTLLAARLDRLDRAERSVLALGAVTGDVFDLGAVNALARGITRGELEQACERLVGRDLLVASAGGALRFRHGVVREAAYASLAKSARARLHERHADWLDGLGEGLREPDAQIALHLEAAWRYHEEIGAGAPPQVTARAGERLAAAAQVAGGRGDLLGEIGFLDRAVAVLGADTAQGAGLLPPLVSALEESGAAARAEKLSQRAISISVALRLPGVGALAAIERERIRLSRHPERFDVAAAVTVVEQATQTLSESGDELGLARGAYLMADLSWLTGDPVASYNYAERMLAHARRAASSFDIATALTFMAWCLVEGPCPAAEALARFDALSAEATGMRAVELTLVGCRAVLMAMTGHYDEARSGMAEARAGLGELQLRGIALYLALLEAVAETLAGDPASAERAVLEAAANAKESGDRWYEALVHVDLVHAVLAQDDRPDTLELVERIETLAAPCDIEWVIKRHTARALMAARAGDPERGLDEARAAVAAADTTRLILSRANAHRTLAELLWATGRTEEAASAVRCALQLDEAKANGVVAASTRARFAGLLDTTPSARGRPAGNAPPGERKRTP